VLSLVRISPPRKAHHGFTLIEVLVTIVLVTVAIVGVLGGIRSVKAADVKAQTADLLQRLATEKITDLRLLQDPSTGGTTGDFTDRGYPDITWSLEETNTSVTNLNQVTLTVTQGTESQSITTLVYIAPQTTTTTTTTAGG
jgi:prepilin-type N-terminal cleavage/methylation domain-containing protein